MKNICVIGSLNMDLVVNVDTMPKPGQTLLGGNFKEVPGGKGANQSVAMARLDGRVSMIGKVGNDSFGKILVKSLNDDNVNTDYIHGDLQQKAARYAPQLRAYAQALSRIYQCPVKKTVLYFFSAGREVEIDPE